MTLAEIAELCGHFGDVVDEFPLADEEVLADAVTARLDWDHQIALAAEWIGMSGSPEDGISVNARAFVIQFIHAIGAEPDEE